MDDDCCYSYQLIHQKFGKQDRPVHNNYRENKFYLQGYDELWKNMQTLADTFLYIYNRTTNFSAPSFYGGKNQKINWNSSKQLNKKYEAFIALND